MEAAVDRPTRATCSPGWTVRSRWSIRWVRAWVRDTSCNSTRGGVDGRVWSGLRRSLPRSESLTGVRSCGVVVTCLGLPRGDESSHVLFVSFSWVEWPVVGAVSGHARIGGCALLRTRACGELGVGCEVPVVVFGGWGAGSAAAGGGDLGWRDVAE